MENLYLFELGRLKKLSLAELNSLLGEENLVEVINQFAIYKLEKPLTDSTSATNSARTLQNSLGGTIKIAEIVESFPLKTDKPKDKIKKSLETLLENHLKNHSGKIPFAITATSIPDNPKVFLKDFLIFSKKFIKSLGFNSRFINKPWSNPTSAQIFKSGSIEKGIDITILGGNHTSTDSGDKPEPKLYIAKSLSIQDINSYSYRDFKKPFRDPRMGMLPPKLSQIMINLAKPQAQEAKGDHVPNPGINNQLHTIYDPFCGSGTILMEAMLQGKDAIGSDINNKAVEGTLTNLYWTSKNFENTPKEFVVFHKDVREVKERDLPGPPDAIVTEGTLGPPQSRVPNESTINKIFTELTDLHQTWLSNLTPSLESDTRIVMCLPAFRRSKNDYIRLPSFDKVAKTANLKILNTEPLIYDRSDQVVAREIVILQVKG